MQAPHAGPAPTPERKISLSPEQEDANTVGQGAVDDAIIIDRTTLTPGISRENAHVFVSQPPDNPEETAQAVENDGRIGELIQALGAQKVEYEARMNEMQFMFQAQLASTLAQTNAGNSNLALPNGVDPSEPVTIGQLAPVLASFRDQMRVESIRSSIGLTGTEEAEVLAKYPYLQGVPEPRKSELIKEAVLLTRPKAPNGDSRNLQASRPAANPGVTQRIARPTPRIVPHTEATGAVSMDDIRPASTAESIRAEYDATAKIQNPKERMLARKRIMEKARQASGLSEEEFAKASWSQR